jgi:hypothetical protein
MNALLVRRAAAVLALAGGAAVAPLSSATAAAPTNGCPKGYDLVSVASLEPLGYQVPGKVDDPNSGIKSFGQPGNGDGFVCSVPLGNQTGVGGVQIYNFWDNTLMS